MFRKSLHFILEHVSFWSRLLKKSTLNLQKTAIKSSYQSKMQSMRLTASGSFQPLLSCMAPSPINSPAPAAWRHHLFTWRYISVCNFLIMNFWCRNFFICYGCLVPDKSFIISPFNVQSQGIPARWQRLMFTPSQLATKDVFGVNSLQEFLVSQCVDVFCGEPSIRRPINV